MVNIPQKIPKEQSDSDEFADTIDFPESKNDLLKTQNVDKSTNEKMPASNNETEVTKRTDYEDNVKHIQEILENIIETEIKINETLDENLEQDYVEKEKERSLDNKEQNQNTVQKELEQINVCEQKSEVQEISKPTDPSQPKNVYDDKQEFTVEKFTQNQNLEDTKDIKIQIISSEPKQFSDILKYEISKPTVPSQPENISEDSQECLAEKFIPDQNLEDNKNIKIQTIPSEPKQSYEISKPTDPSQQKNISQDNQESMVEKFIHNQNLDDNKKTKTQTISSEPKKFSDILKHEISKPTVSLQPENVSEDNQECTPLKSTQNQNLEDNKDIKIQTTSSEPNLNDILEHTQDDLKNENLENVQEEFFEPQNEQENEDIFVDTEDKNEEKEQSAKIELLFDFDKTKEEEEQLKISEELKKSNSSLNRGGKYNKHMAPVPPQNLEPKTKQTSLLNVSYEDTPFFKLANEISKSQEKLNEKIETNEVTQNEQQDNQTKNSLKQIEDTIKQIEESTNKIEDTNQFEDSSNEFEDALNEDSHPIKATLVIKPGIIKSVPSGSEEPKQIFLNKSQKLKKKTKRSKDKSPISRLMMLPKKLWGTKEHDLNTKRKSISSVSESEEEYEENKTVENSPNLKKRGDLDSD